MNARAALVVAALLAGCSTLEPIPKPEECTSDKDCDRTVGEVCAPDSKLCVRGDAVPPRGVLGFDIQEIQGTKVVFRVEVAGCDREVKTTGVSANNELTISRIELEQTFELSAYAKAPPPEGVPVTVDDLVAGEFVLSQPSRFALGTSASRRVSYPTLDTEIGEVVLPTQIRWARYHPEDALPRALADGGFVLWQTLPQDGAPLYQMLAPPLVLETRPCEDDTDCCKVKDTCDDPAPNYCHASGFCTAIRDPHWEFAYQYESRCSRELAGQVREISADYASTKDVEGATVALRYRDTPGDPRLGVYAIARAAPGDRTSQCTGDDECVAGEQFCDPDGNGQCMLALAGRPADVGTTFEGSAFTTEVYTYCERDPANQPVFRSFTASVTVPGPPPPITYAFTTQFPPPPGGQEPSPGLVDQPLCVLDPGPSIDASFALDGEPITLTGTGSEAWTCCDVGCLPATEDAFKDAVAMGGAMPPTPPQTCTGATVAGGVATAAISAGIELSPDDAAQWIATGCALPEVADDGTIATLRPAVQCTDDVEATCSAAGVALAADGSPRTYALRVETPPGSLVGSIRRQVVVDGASGSFATTVELPRRVRVSGRVRLDDATCERVGAEDAGCGAEAAVVLAERLRMPGESAQNVAGPYFHEVDSFFDPVTLQRGRYILPLDPGVYVVTALPASGAQGGPADVRIVDVRDGVDTSLDLVLRQGILVTLNMCAGKDPSTCFDRRTQVIPLDRGTWVGLEHPGRPGESIDLNAIGECLTPPVEGDQACKIRRLIPGASLSAGQVGQLRFTARSSTTGASCG